MSGIRIQPTRSTIEYRAGKLPVLEISLGGTPRGVVVLVCDETDSSDGVVEWMNRFAEHGYETLAATVPWDCSFPLLDTVFFRTEGRGWTAEQTGLVGWGSGGRVVLDAATRLSFGAAVSMSASLRDGSCTSSDEFEGGVATPWLGLFGTEDPEAPERLVTGLRSALDRGADVHTEVVRYPGVGADFYRQGNDGVGYAAWYDGWQRTVEWLEARIAPRLTPFAQQWRQREVVRA